MNAVALTTACATLGTDVASAAAHPLRPPASTIFVPTTVAECPALSKRVFAGICHSTSFQPDAEVCCWGMTT